MGDYGSQINESSLLLFNVLSRTEVIEKELWLERTEELKMMAIRHSLYPMGPLVMTMEQIPEDESKTRFTFYLPLNGKYHPDPEDGCSFLPALTLEHTLSVRHHEEGKPFSASYEEMECYAREHHLSVKKPVYHVMIPVYGDYFAEIHMPVG
ncbi:DUF5085 family protein [Sporolactobacillus sp. Y61]|uniref:DUF5085 family protein n=1 Tax=Sporolactobacillus sp. Y61 TaxID=3160863 RepID=A0AAU8IID5_9BACL